MARPTTPVLDWATDTNYAAGASPWSGNPTKIAPPSGLTATGFVPSDPVAAQHMNSVIAQMRDWLAYLEEQTADPDMWMMHDGILRDCSVLACETQVVSSSGAAPTVTNAPSGDGAIRVTLAASSACTMYFRTRHDSRISPTYGDGFLFYDVISVTNPTPTISLAKAVAPAIGGMLTLSTLQTKTGFGVGSDYVTGNVGTTRGYLGGGVFLVLSTGSGGGQLVVDVKRLGYQVASSGPSDI